MNDPTPQGAPAPLTEQAAPPLGTLRFCQHRVGLLVPFAVLLAVVAWLVMTRVPTYDGYTWLVAVHILRDVALRAWFPTAALTAWALGYHSNHGQRQGFLSALQGLWQERSHGQRLRTALGGILIAGCAAVATRFVSADYTVVDIAVVTLATVWVCHQRASRANLKAALSGLLRMAILFTAVSYVYTVVKSQLFVVRPAADATIVAMETALFGEPPHRLVVRAASAHPWLLGVFEQTYYRLFDHMTVGSMFLVGASRQREQARLWIALSVCYIIGGFSYYILAAYGPCYTEPQLYETVQQHLPMSHWAQQGLFENSRLMGGTKAFVLPTYAFVACMPSLHMAHEFTLLYYARWSRTFFALTAAFLALTWVSTLGLGWHYASDGLGGLALAALSVWVAERYGTALFPTAIRERAARALHALGELGWVILLLLLGVMAAHGATLTNSFVLDDAWLAVSSQLQELSTLPLVLAEGLYHYSGEPRLFHVFRPLAGLAQWLIYQGFTVLPGGHHLVSLGLLLGLLVAATRLLRQLGVSLAVALGGALFLALHPLASETVAYLSARDLLLGWTLWLFVISLTLDERRTGPTWYWVAAATGLASLAHESFLLIGFCALALPLAASKVNSAPRVRQALVGHAVGVAAALAARGFASSDAWTLRDPLPLIASVSKRSVQKLLLPVDLSPLVTPEIGSRGLGWLLLFSLVGLAALCVGWTRRSSEFRALGVASLVAVGVLLSQALSAGVAGTIADRETFGVLVALVLAAAPAVDRGVSVLWSRFDRPRKIVFSALLAPMALAALPFCWSSGLTYRSEASLAQLLLLTNPDEPATQAHAGLLLALGGEDNEAEQLCTTASRSAAVFADTELCLSLILAHRGRDDEALTRITAYLERLPTRSRARELLWYLLSKHDRKAELTTWLERLRLRVGDQPDILAARQALSGVHVTQNPWLTPGDSSKKDP